MGNKYTIILFNFLFLFSLNALVHSATITWINNSPDNFASNPANWSGGMIPQDGDKVVFDAASTDDCSWDFTVTVSSFMIEPGYTGKVIITSFADLSIENYKTWTGAGSDNLASNPLNWSDNTMPQTGDKIIFDDTSLENCTWDTDIDPASLKLSGYTGTLALNTDLTINGSLTVLSGTLTLNDKNLNVDSYLLISANGNLYATSSAITVKGDWANAGNFSPGTSTVILNGSNQHLYGNTTFYNLIRTATFTDTLYFEAGSTQTILNNLTLQGTEANLLSLRSTAAGNYWYIDPRGTRNVAFVNIRDSYNTNFTRIILLPDSVDSGNNTGISFGGSQCAYLTPLWQGGCDGTLRKYSLYNELGLTGEVYAEQKN